MWNGAAPSLKATPATMNTTPVSSSMRWSPPPPSASPAASKIAGRCSEPVAPYTSDMPYSSRPEASEPSTMYFIAASADRPSSRFSATSAYEHSASSSRPR